ncbi:uncharacterized protein DNG_09659 [Cephalotrichum gorgonifer]|uniref:Uncharacterized protein n=1 Tax=Cephalotrichum gorgonifer TaxID=2041049 RepID=A0AAE8N643_9PEZI|nr:uncharacterized protein DNG_09659 [Cephalotrichum gorgonifer]
MNQPDAAARFNRVRQQVRLQFQYIEEDVPRATGLAAWWDLFTEDYFALVGERARAWANDVTLAAAAPFEQARQDGRSLAIFGHVVGALEEMLRGVGALRVPGDDTMPLPQPPGGGF